MHVFVVLGLVFSVPSQEIGLGKRLRNDLFCVEWDIKAQLNQSLTVKLDCLVCLLAVVTCWFFYNELLCVGWL